MSVILLRLGSALILVGSLGCESTGVPTVMYHDYQEYLSKSHYRAFAATPHPTQGSAAAWGYSWSYGTVEGAIERALEKCQKGQAFEFGKFLLSETPKNSFSESLHI